jgi:hypothetical protein
MSNNFITTSFQNVNLFATLILSLVLLLPAAAFTVVTEKVQP